MNKIVSTLILLFCIAFFKVSAQIIITLNNINYECAGDTAVVTGYEGDAPKRILKIPSTVTEGENIYTVTHIADEAFSGCDAITMVSLPESLISIGEKAFSECSGLFSISFSEELSTIGDYSFYKCTSLRELNFPESLVHIGTAAFSGCNELETVVFPTEMTEIEDDAFSFCSSLESVTLPERLISIGVQAFAYCISLKTILLSEETENIGNGAFYNCISLTNILLPETVTAIGDYAFSQCRILSDIIYAGDEEPEIGNKTFENISSGSILHAPNTHNDFTQKDWGVSAIVYGNEPTSLQMIDEIPEIIVFGERNAVIISGPEGMPYQLFNVSGKLLRQGFTTSSREYLNVEGRGIYIVKAGDIKEKVAVK